MGQLEDRRSLSMTVLMTPDMANFAGKVHGGTLLKFLDQVAYSCASRYAGAYAVTLSVDRVLFRDAILVGELVSFSATVNYTENIRDGTRRHTNSSYFTMVAVDDAGNPVSVPPLVPVTELECVRHQAAVARRSALRAAFAD